MILVRFQGKPFSITVIQICTLTTDAKEAEVDWFYDDLQHLLTNTHTHTQSPFPHRGLKCKSQKSRDTWNKRHVWPCTKWSKAKANRVLLRELAGHMQTLFFSNPRDNSMHGHHQVVNTEIRLIMFFAAKDGKALYSHQKQDLELAVTQIMSSLLQNSVLNWRK